MPDENLGPVDRVKNALAKGPPSAHTHPTAVDRYFPWWVRICVVVLLALVARSWSGNPLGEQVGGAMQYTGLVFVSISASFWWYYFVGNLFLALSWLVWPATDLDDDPFYSAVQIVLTFVNRQLGHVQALTWWAVLAVVSSNHVVWQLPAVAAVFLLGEPLLNFIVGLVHRGNLSHPRPDLSWRRRPFIYLVTYIALGIIALLSPPQAYKLLPALLTLIIPDILRVIRHVLWTRRMFPRHAGEMDPRKGSPDLYASHHRRQLDLAKRVDLLLGPLLLFLIMGAILVGNSFLVRRYIASLSTGPGGEPRDYTGIPAPGAPRDDVALFLVSDNQFHELGGERFGGQMALAEALVPVAARPLELDLLSAAPLWRFGRLYGDLAKARAHAGNGPLPWAHLGDMSDLSCHGEQARTGSILMRLLGRDGFSGVAPGNHDKVFTGNFSWNPNWDTACSSHRLEKFESDQGMLALWGTEAETPPGRLGSMRPIPTGSFIPKLTKRGTGLVTVSPLGTIAGPDGHATRRGVIGVYLDSSDGQAFDLGIAGANGTFSREQDTLARQMVADVGAKAASALGPAFADPLYVVLFHHPFAKIIWPSSKRLRAFLGWLDGFPSTTEGGPRLVSLITAHTHRSQSHSHCIEGRVIPEIIVGSTLDPPQEAALVTMGPTPDGATALRVRTLPSVTRTVPQAEGLPPLARLSPATCQSILGDLRAHPACEPLFRASNPNVAPKDCSTLEHPVDMGQRLLQALKCTVPTDEDELKDLQQKRADALWACMCRDGRCSGAPGEFALEREAFFPLLLSELQKGPEREAELACFAWAASMVQRFKTSGMTFADALRCGFDGDNAPAGKDYIARMEVVPCR